MIKNQQKCEAQNKTALEWQGGEVGDSRRRVNASELIWGPPSGPVVVFFCCPVKTPLTLSTHELWSCDVEEIRRCCDGVR